MGPSRLCFAIPLLCLWRCSVAILPGRCRRHVQWPVVLDRLRDGPQRYERLLQHFEPPCGLGRPGGRHALLRLKKNGLCPTFCSNVSLRSTMAHCEGWFSSGSAAQARASLADLGSFFPACYHRGRSQCIRINRVFRLFASGSGATSLRSRPLTPSPRHRVRRPRGGNALQGAIAPSEGPLRPARGGRGALAPRRAGSRPQRGRAKDRGKRHPAPGELGVSNQ